MNIRIRKHINAEDIGKIWTLADETVELERRYDSENDTNIKARISLSMTNNFRDVRLLGEEAMRMYVTCLEILRDRRSA